MKPVETKRPAPLLKYQESLKSSFFSKEKLFEFFKGELSPADRKTTEDFLSGSLTLRQELENMVMGQNFMSELKALQVSEQALARIQVAKPLSWDLRQRLDFSEWSSGLRQSAAIIASAVVALGIFLIVPWGNLYHQFIQQESKQIVLVETPRIQSELDLSTYEKQEKPEFTDEKEVAKTSPADHAVPTPTAEAPVAQILKPVAEKSPPAPSENTDTSAPQAAGSRGYLYRSRIFISNLQDTKPKITEKIIELGGRKAGDVALGWKKTPESAYYHFTMPENKLAELNQFLALYGESKIVKEKHPRVMAQGIIRLILEFEETKP
jgi:hypothetical protein